MALQITEKNNTFYLKGNINRETSEQFFKYFKKLTRILHKVIVNIDDLREIDSDGVSAFKRLLSDAFEKQHEFLVIGEGCKDIYYDFQC